MRRATGPGPARLASCLDFYPRSPCGERRAARITPAPSRNFYPRSPCGERLFANFEGFYWWVISIHALLAESDKPTSGILRFNPLFLSTLSLRRATNGFAGVLFLIDISIHALLAESDLTSVVNSTGTMDFYPRSPCGERPIVYDIVLMPREFLSTLSLRRATTHHRTRR